MALVGQLLGQVTDQGGHLLGQPPAALDGQVDGVDKTARGQVAIDLRSLHPGPREQADQHVKGPGIDVSLFGRQLIHIIGGIVVQEHQGAAAKAGRQALPNLLRQPRIRLAPGPGWVGGNEPPHRRHDRGPPRVQYLGDAGGGRELVQGRQRGIEVGVGAAAACPGGGEPGTPDGGGKAVRGSVPQVVERKARVQGALPPQLAERFVALPFQPAQGGVPLRAVRQQPPRLRLPVEITQGRLTVRITDRQRREGQDIVREEDQAGVLAHQHLGGNAAELEIVSVRQAEIDDLEVLAQQFLQTVGPVARGSLPVTVEDTVASQNHGDLVRPQPFPCQRAHLRDGRIIERLVIENVVEAGEAAQAVDAGQHAPRQAAAHKRENDAGQ